MQDIDSGVELDPAICTIEWVALTGEIVGSIDAIESEQEVVEGGYFTTRELASSTDTRYQVPTDYFVVEATVREITSRRRDSAAVSAGDIIRVVSPVPRSLDSLSSGSVVALAEGALNGEPVWTAQAWGSPADDGALSFDSMCGDLVTDELGDLASSLGRRPDSELLGDLTRLAYEENSLLAQSDSSSSSEEAVAPNLSDFQSVPPEHRQLLAGEVPASLSDSFELIMVNFVPSRDLIDADLLIRLHSDLGQSYLGSGSVEGPVPILVPLERELTLSIGVESSDDWTSIGLLSLESNAPFVTLKLSASAFSAETSTAGEFRTLTNGADLTESLDGLRARWFVDSI